MQNLDRRQVALLLLAVAIVAFIAARLGAQPVPSSGAAEQGMPYGAPVNPIYTSQPAYPQQLPSFNQPAQAPGAGSDLRTYQQQQWAEADQRYRQQQVQDELRSACTARGGFYGHFGCSK